MSLRDRDQQREQSQLLTSGPSLSRAALTSQTQSTGRKDKRISECFQAVSLGGFAGSPCPKMSQVCSCFSHGLHPGQESKPSQRSAPAARAEPAGSYQKNLTPRPSSSVMISALCSCCKACRARSSIASSKPWNSREGQRCPSIARRKSHQETRRLTKPTTGWRQRSRGL